jgi:hypothetical protein
MKRIQNNLDEELLSWVVTIELVCTHQATAMHVLLLCRHVVC